MNNTNYIDLFFRCENGMPLHLRRNYTAAARTSSTTDNDITDFAINPIVYLSVLVVFCVMVIVALSLFICNIQKRRPRIKKRIIVNKSVTPLTYRPQQPSEQCEITIENCCNMNICETVRNSIQWFKLKRKENISIVEGCCTFDNDSLL